MGRPLSVLEPEPVVEVEPVKKTVKPVKKAPKKAARKK